MNRDDIKSWIENNQDKVSNLLEVVSRGFYEESWCETTLSEKGLVRLLEKYTEDLKTGGNNA